MTPNRPRFFPSRQVSPQSRRQFLLQTATTVALGPRLALAAAESAAPLSLGFSLYGMKTLPLAQAVAACARIGYRNVELALIAGFPTEPAKLTPEVRTAAREHCSAAGLRISSLIANLSLVGDAATHAAHLAVLRQAAQFAREIDAVAPPVVQTVLGGKPATWETEKAGMAVRLRAWDAIARDHGIVVAIKAHVGSAVNSPDRLLWLLREAAVTHVVVAYDHSHFALGGLGVAASLAPLASRTRFVHLKDAEGDATRFSFLLPGEGQADFRAIFRELIAAGYHGPVVVEVSSQIFSRPGYDPIATAERCYAALAPALPV